MQVADPDKDGKANLMIAGERDGRIYSLEYKGTGNPADSANWDLQVLFNIYDYSGILPGAADDPLSRLVAAGVLMRTERITPPDIAAAVDTASSEGWRRPLVAWLGVEEARARSAGDVDAAAALRRRIELVLEGK